MNRALVEKVARAIEREHMNAYEWDDDQFEVWWNKDWRNNHRDERIAEATAAIAAVYEALREPSDEMLEAGLDWDNHVEVNETYPHSRGTWRGMLAASPIVQEGEE